MIRFSILILLLVLGIISESCNSEDICRSKNNIQTVHIQPNWGDVLLLDLVMKKKKTVNLKGLATNNVSESDIELMITKLNSKEYSCNWKVVKTKHKSKKIDIQDLFSRIGDGIDYNFIIDSKGELIELRNWKEIKEKGLKALKKAVNLIRKKKIMKRQLIDQLTATYSEMYGTREKIETYLMQDVQSYFSLLGVKIKKKKLLREIVISDNPLSGENIYQVLETSLKNTYSDSTADLQLIQTFLESDVLNSLNLKNKTKIVDDISTNDFDVKIINNFNVSFKTGVVKSLVTEKHIKLNNLQKIDRTEIVVK